MDPKHVILRNFAWSDEYDQSSFTGRLHEYCEWQIDEYWLLEWALYQLAGARAGHAELHWPIFRIFSHTFLSINANFDPNDAFEFTNIDRSAAYDLRERFQLVFEGYFSGDLPDQETCFEVHNPLLSADG